MLLPTGLTISSLVSRLVSLGRIASVMPARNATGVGQLHDGEYHQGHRDSLLRCQQEPRRIPNCVVSTPRVYAETLLDSYRQQALLPPCSPCQCLDAAPPWLEGLVHVLGIAGSIWE